MAEGVGTKHHHSVGGPNFSLGTKLVDAIAFLEEEAFWDNVDAESRDDLHRQEHLYSATVDGVVDREKTLPLAVNERGLALTTSLDVCIDIRDVGA